MQLSDELKWRGFVNQTTLKDVNVLNGDPISFYIGVDPSADSMTIGNLASVMMVRAFVEHGHKAHLLVGGATGLIGDPDGKATERDVIKREDIERNKQAIANQYKQLFDGKPFTLVDNYDWFKDINYLDFLRDVGKHVPLSSMLAREFVQNRLGAEGSGISYAEFSYSLIQGYDFLHLFREYGVTMQVCGADQWGNSITGVDLIRRLEGKEAHVYTTPLVVNKSTGVKFGKSEDGAIWLDANKTSVYKFYQFWLNVDDESVIDLLKVFTTLDKPAIESLEAKHNENPAAREAHRALAHEVTMLVHGKDRTDSVERVTGVLFGETAFSSLTDQDKEMLRVEIPTAVVGTNLIAALAGAGIAPSNGAVRRLLEGGAITIDGEKVMADKTIETSCLVKKGKNTFVLFV